MLPAYDRFFSSTAKNIKASEIREILAIIRKRKDVISLAGGIPDPRTFPRDELAEIARRMIIEYGDQALQYSETKGILEVREMLSHFLLESRGISVDAENIIVTTGSQQALDLVARTLLDPGDIVITENPSYLAALGAFKNRGARLVGIKIDKQGMRTDLLEETVKKLVSEGEKIKFIYTIPVSQNPAGTTMPPDRKKHLIEIANKYDLLVVEDDPYSYFVYDETVDVSPIKAYDSEDRVLYMSTVSKILAPGLRIGWIASPEKLTRKLELVKQYMDLHSPTLNQYIVAEAIRTGLVTRHAHELSPFYKKKRDAMIKAIKDYFPENVWHTEPVGGFFVFVYVNKEGFDTGKLLRKAIDKYKVAYVPGQSFHTDGTGANSMRLSFSYPPPEIIEEGIRRIAELIKNEN
ncbi:PLP-dependent aminotransferase family protein [Staphylothermus hellenicus]|uniref:Putative transcriptional regulator, GntR family n=1 Tax=Staphylothermus hellenicus (strain DSM 12710 / JCM 10830 / BK20S6-10-b1 / P8) TaxID=591019 RepID=D7D8W5_STAHD|nr:putative transcriptional regulator, GntR family [Staphylothermus hellenicus DSM 12710]